MWKVIEKSKVSYFYYYCCIIQESKTIKIKELKKLNQVSRELFLFLRQIKILKPYKFFFSVLLCIKILYYMWGKHSMIQFSIHWSAFWLEVSVDKSIVKSVFLNTLLQSAASFLGLVSKGPFAKLPKLSPLCYILSLFSFILSITERNNSWTHQFA